MKTLGLDIGGTKTAIGIVDTKKMNIIGSPSVNPLKPQINITQEHISGNRGTHISGGPPSSHISGQ